MKGTILQMSIFLTKHATKEKKHLFNKWSDDSFLLKREVLGKCSPLYPSRDLGISLQQSYKKLDPLTLTKLKFSKLSCYLKPALSIYLFVIKNIYFHCY